MSTFGRCYRLLARANGHDDTSGGPGRRKCDGAPIRRTPSRLYVNGQHRRYGPAVHPVDMVKDVVVAIAVRGKRHMIAINLSNVARDRRIDQKSIT